MLTPRGALVRDALAWSKYLEEAVALFGAGSEVMFAQHHWPRWGQQRLVEYLRSHRDLYRYLHDQTLRLANTGYTASEIAAEVRLPPALARTWACRGYYGTVSFNVRAIYHRYLGFFDGNPAHLDELPPVEAGRHYVELAEDSMRCWMAPSGRSGRVTIAGARCSRATRCSPSRTRDGRASSRRARSSSWAISQRARFGGTST